MISRDQLARAINALHEKHIALCDKSKKLEDDILKIQSSFDEKFIYAVLKRNGLCGTKEYKLMDDFWVCLRQPKEVNDCFFRYSFCRENDFSTVNAVSYWKKRHNYFGELYGGIYTNRDDFPDTTFSQFVSRLTDYGYGEWINDPEKSDNELYTKVVAFVNKINRLNERIDFIYKYRIHGFAEYMKDIYNKAVELDNRNVKEFEELIGIDLQRKQISVTVTISEV